MAGGRHLRILHVLTQIAQVAQVIAVKEDLPTQLALQLALH
jgi:hypothetical protein